MVDRYRGLVWFVTCTNKYESVRRSGSGRGFENGAIHMLCVLCQHDEAVERHALCLPCLEMIGRLQLLAELINTRSMSKLKAAAGRAEYGQEI